MTPFSSHIIHYVVQIFQNIKWTLYIHPCNFVLLQPEPKFGPSTGIWVHLWDDHCPNKIAGATHRQLHAESPLELLASLTLKECPPVLHSTQSTACTAMISLPNSKPHHRFHWLRNKVRSQAEAAVGAKKKTHLFISFLLEIYRS